MIKASKITKQYRDGSALVTAVNNADLDIDKGKFILIIGRSGSGKSTLLSMLGGLTRPDSGTVHLDGIDIWSLSDARLSAIRAEKIGFVFQFSGIMPTLNAAENVMLPSIFVRNKDRTRERADDLLAMLGIGDKKNSYASQMSGGELKRVAIARSLMNDPEIVLADEPTGDLDIDTEREILEVFTGIRKQGTTIIMVTHNPDLASYADRVIRMERGSVVEER